MKNVLLSIVLSVFSISCIGCQQGATHKDTFIVATQIAINHMEFERSLALQECEKDQTPFEECDNAISFDRWTLILSTFKQTLEKADTLQIGAEEVGLIIDTIVSEMGPEINPRAMLYLQDLKVILQMMLRDSETRIIMKDMVKKQ